MSSILTVIDTVLGQGEEIFQSQYEEKYKKKTCKTCKVDKNTQMRIMSYYPPASPSILSYDTKILQFLKNIFSKKRTLVNTQQENVSAKTN